MTDIRQKLREDLQLRGLAEQTVTQYLGCASVFLRYHGEPSPDDLSSDQVRRFLLDLADRGRSSSTRSVYYASLKYLFGSVGRPEVLSDVPRPRVRTENPGRALTRAEVQALLDLLSPRPFDHAFFALMLATGLRISEATALQVQDIDRRSGLLHVRRGKGGKPRSVMLSPCTLRLLERHWRTSRPRAPLLFPARCVGWGPGEARPWANHAVSPDVMAHRLKEGQGDVPRPVRSHDLRRTFATWLIEDGYDLRLVQVLLGHASPETTARYTRVHSDVIARMRSPFDRL